MWDGYGYGMSNGFGGLGIILAIFWWVLVIVAIITFGKWVWGHDRSSHEREVGEERTPLDILKDRYAKGEINKAEFEEKKKDIYG